MAIYMCVYVYVYAHLYAHRCMCVCTFCFAGGTHVRMYMRLCMYILVQFTCRAVQSLQYNIVHNFSK